jgi:uncharacterized membrane protein
MERKAKLFGHPIHPMLIPFPLGLLGTAVVFDLIDALGGSDGLGRAADYVIAAGIVSGLAAVIFGAIDWLATIHGPGNVVIVALFALAWMLRRDDPADPGTATLVLEVIALVTCWLGGELVDRLGVGVDPGAHVNSLNSLSGRPAHET